ncbi:MAG: sigma 54-interacting transcriptional regulator, partial [Sedimentibacter sp.]
MQKKIILVTGSTNTKQFLLEQLKEIIPSNYTIEAYESEKKIIPSLKCDLLIVSSALMKEELDQMNIEYDPKNTIVCERSINFDYIDQVADIPVNQEVLLVNDELDNTTSAINDLIELGLNHIKYYPYYPGIASYKKLKIAITPGEPDKVPPCVTKIIDMGPRIIDINTLYTIMDRLHLTHRDTTFITKKYMQKIINVSKRIAAINSNVNTLNVYLNNIVDSLANGIIVIDENGYIKYANDEMTKILSLGKNIENKNIRNIVDKEMLPYFLSSDIFENKSMYLMGVSIKMTKFNVPNSNNIVVTTSRDKKNIVKKSFSQDLLLKGHYAKYNFDNIIGESNLLNETKNIALKLSKSELTVLIEGESGTGKELFASAIHNNSSRKFGPFLALNFSALPDDLIESELFGYEEGAFTGAKKGGKIGLFELADGGTIFLDEIGDVSPKLQTKLLRVLQEKEVMPIGGTAIRKVDVRIIAATNRNLKDMVLEKQFRSDLYYRLKIGYVSISPLR